MLLLIYQLTHSQGSDLRHSAAFYFMYSLRNLLHFQNI